MAAAGLHVLAVLLLPKRDQRMVCGPAATRGLRTRQQQADAGLAFDMAGGQCRQLLLDIGIVKNGQLLRLGLQFFQRQWGGLPAAAVGWQCVQRHGSQQVGAEGIQQRDIVIGGGLQALCQRLAHGAGRQQAAKKCQTGPVAKSLGLQGQMQGEWHGIGMGQPVAVVAELQPAL